MKKEIKNKQSNKKGRSGRKSKLTNEVKEILFNAIKLGLPIRSACIYAGITERTYYHWKEKAEKAKTESNKYYQLFQEIKKAEQIAKASLLANIKKDGSWQSSAWILERRWPDEFGRGVNKVALTDPNGEKDYTGDFIELSRQEAKRRLAALLGVDEDQIDL